MPSTNTITSVTEILSQIEDLSDSDKHSLVRLLGGEHTILLGDDSLVDESIAAGELGLAAPTLSTWRSTGRNHLPYLKIGRLVKYRMGDIREFKRSRIVDTRPDDPEAG